MPRPLSWIFSHSRRVRSANRFAERTLRKSFSRGSSHHHQPKPLQHPLLQLRKHKLIRRDPHRHHHDHHRHHLRHIIHLSSHLEQESQPPTLHRENQLRPHQRPPREAESLPQAGRQRWQTRREQNIPIQLPSPCPQHSPCIFIRNMNRP